MTAVPEQAEDVGARKTLRRYCLCGGAATARSTPPAAAEDVIRMFEQLHTGDGHGPATARQAAAARRRNEEQA